MTCNLLQQVISRDNVDRNGFALYTAFDAIATVRQSVVALLFTLPASCAGPKRSFSLYCASPFGFYCLFIFPLLRASTGRWHDHCGDEDWIYSCKA